MSDNESAYVDPAITSMTPMTAYAVVHYLLQKFKGSASKHWCVECSKPARHWAYDHKDAFARIDTSTGQVFSVNFDHYQPMCSSCHQKLDAAHPTRRAHADETAVA